MLNYQLIRLMICKKFGLKIIDAETQLLYNEEFDEPSMFLN